MTFNLTVTRYKKLWSQPSLITGLSHNILLLTVYE